MLLPATVDLYYIWLLLYIFIYSGLWLFVSLQANTLSGYFLSMSSRHEALTIQSTCEAEPRLSFLCSQAARARIRSLLRRACSTISPNSRLAMSITSVRDVLSHNRVVSELKLKNKVDARCLEPGSASFSSTSIQRSRPHDHPGAPTFYGLYFSHHFTHTVTI